jgi:hypothetical protein
MLRRRRAASLCSLIEGKLGAEQDGRGGLAAAPLALLIDKVAICLCRCWIVAMAGQHFVQMSLSRRKAAAFVRWHEPDDARVSSPDL